MPATMCLLALPAFGEADGGLAAPRTCLDCHDSERSEHVLRSLRSQHRRAGVDCVDCHDGDAACTTGDRESREPYRALADAQEQAQICGGCHTEVLRLFTNSRMWKKGHAAGGAPTCTGCHSAQGSELLRGDEVRQRCAECHDRDGRAGPGDIPDRAAELLRDLHRLSLTRVLVREAILARKVRGFDMTAELRRLDAIDHTVGDPVLEWHRFDLVKVESVTLRAIRELETIYEDLD